MKMRKQLFLTLTLVIMMAIMTGCGGFAITHPGGAGNTAPAGVRPGVITGNVTYPNYVGSITRFEMTADDFTVLKTVTAEASSRSILGLFASGDNGYGKLWEKARAIGADDVINIKVDTCLRSILVGFYVQSTVKLTGQAIRYNKK